ncbi:MAG: hypothetical protein JJT89_08745 [Nitriliruptoraceae bacterium]|nr:hypothetical protein [Nitriliruptoraceae bacterium]
MTWLAAVCALLIVVLLALGERTLPLFGGDAELAARVYRTTFMLLITGVAVGLIPAMHTGLATFLDRRIAASGTEHARARPTVGFLRAAGPWLAAMVGVGGLGLTVSIWLAE